MMLRMLIPCEAPEDTDAHTPVTPCLPLFAPQLLDLPQFATASDFGEALCQETLYAGICALEQHLDSQADQ